MEELLAKAKSAGISIDNRLLMDVVEQNDKQRFSLSSDGLRIRASQGHSIPVDLGLRPLKPPDLLFHGTVERFLSSIKLKGLIAGKRNHVHLSPDESTAIKVGQRRGKPVILTIQAGRMHNEGYTFYLSANGVWLAEEVPREYIAFPER